MPVEFLSDEEVAAYGGFVGSPSPTELARWCLLDDADLRLVNRRRVDHLRLGFALQLVTVRALGLFLVDPLDVPTVVIDEVASQLGVTDASCVKRYTGRRPTRFDHQGEIVEAYGYHPFAPAVGQLERWVADRAFTSGEGPKALFAGAVGWLRERQVLLPGVSTLARLVARVREGATQRVYNILAGQVNATQAKRLDAILEVPEGVRVSLLERWRHGPRAVSGKAMVAALTRTAEIGELGVGENDLSGVPPRRVIELARYGMAAKAPALRRLPRARRIATLLATARWLWRTDPAADYGPLNPAARGRIDLDRIAAHWPDILRVVTSIHTATVTAHDVIRVLSRGGNLTQLGEAIAQYGRIYKTRHVLACVDVAAGEPYRREIKGMRNLQEGRHALARHIFHGRQGELYQAYREGMEDQLGALGLILNCVTLWNTAYLNAALEQLRSQGHPVLDTDVAHLSAYLRGHVNVHGHYSFVAPTRQGLRVLRDPDAEELA